MVSIGHIFILRIDTFQKALSRESNAQRYTKNEAFSLKFTPGYNLCFKEDWLEVICALLRLLRYIISGKVKVGAVQVNM